jgi:hypothetical protein
VPDRPPETARESTPSQLAQVTPTYQQAVGATYLSEALMQMQATLGELRSDVRHLTTASEKQSTKIDKISHIIFAAGAVLTVLLAITGFFINKIWDGLVIVMKASGH